MRTVPNMPLATNYAKYCFMGFRMNMKINAISNFIYKIPIFSELKQLENLDTPEPDLSEFSLSEYYRATKPMAVVRQNILKHSQKLLKPIKSKEEYETVLSRVLQYKAYNDKPFVNLSGYEDTDTELKGLVPYCGESDKSHHINMWLTGRQSKRCHLLDDEKMADVVRILDYSLQKADRKYGKYEGIVYRKGFFNPVTDSQYYSSSINPASAVLHLGKTTPAHDNPYSIIKLKNGHNIYKFQKDTNSSVSGQFAEREQEILIDRKSRFRLIPPSKYTDEERLLKKSFLNNFVTIDTSDKSQREKIDMYNSLAGYISVWEEI